MTMVDWDDSYSLDIPEIDEQHKCLIAIMNALYTALANKSEPQRIGQVLAYQAAFRAGDEQG